MSTRRPFDLCISVSSERRAEAAAAEHAKGETKDEAKAAQLAKV